MKMTTICIVAVSLLACRFTTLGQGYSLHWKTNRIGVAFVDSTLGAATKSAIVADMQYCLSGWGANVEIMMRPQGASVGYMYYGRANPYYRDEMAFPKNIIIDPATSGLALQVPKALSDAYTNAFAFAAANASIVTAAHEFVSFVSSSNFMAISSNAMPNYVIYKNENITSNVLVESASEILSELRWQTYFQPSVLGFFQSTNGPAATNLWVQIPCTSQSRGSSVRWFPFAAVWHDGKWKFTMWEEWF